MVPLSGFNDLSLAAVDIGELAAANVEAGVFLVIGALGGAHCLGMCGPLVSVYADRLEATGVEYKPTAYRRAAENVREHTAPIENLAGEGEDAVAEIDRVGDEEGITGVYMITGGAEPPLGNRQYEPVYQAASEKDLTICYHTSGAGIDNYHTKGYEKLIETHTLGFVENNFAQAVSVLVQGIPEKFPDLDFVFLEAGIFYVSLLMSRLDCEYLKRPSEAPLLEQRPSEYIKESFYFGTQPLETEVDPKYLETVIEMIGGAGRLMYASDYPHWDYDRPTTVIDLPFLSEEEKRGILSENAAEVFGL